MKMYLLRTMAGVFTVLALSFCAGGKSQGDSSLLLLPLLSSRSTGANGGGGGGSVVACSSRTILEGSVMLETAIDSGAGDLTGSITWATVSGQALNLSPSTLLTNFKSAAGYLRTATAPLDSTDAFQLVVSTTGNYVLSFASTQTNGTTYTGDLIMGLYEDANNDGTINLGSENITAMASTAGGSTDSPTLALTAGRRYVIYAINGNSADRFWFIRACKM